MAFDREPQPALEEAALLLVVVEHGILNRNY